MKKTVFYFIILIIMSLFTISCGGGKSDGGNDSKLSGGGNDSKLIGKWKCTWDKFPDKVWYMYVEVEKNGDSYKLTDYDILDGSPNRRRKTNICTFENNIFSGSEFYYDESKKAIVEKAGDGGGSDKVYYREQ
jgi:hypothetical protein